MFKKSLLRLVSAGLSQLLLWLCMSVTLESKCFLNTLSKQAVFKYDQPASLLDIETLEENGLDTYTEKITLITRLKIHRSLQPALLVNNFIIQDKNITSSFSGITNQPFYIVKKCFLI